MSEALGRRRSVLAGIAAGILMAGALAGGLRAQSTLFYLELQAVAAYATASDRVEWFSLMPEDVMQKPSLGFDLVQRVSSKTRDIGVFGLQARLAYDQEGRKLQPQLFNAFFRLKTRLANFWVGHSRPAMGLASVLDNHALLLPDATMFGFGYDRDWGVGFDRDFPSGGIAASLTAGSGMPLYFKGNYLAAARLFKGVLARDNYSLGFSIAHGRLLETMGYRLVEPEPVDWTLVGLDVSTVYRNFENRVEVLVGRQAETTAFLLFWRPGLTFLEEGRLKVELQPALLRKMGAWDYSLGAGLTYLLNADLAGRVLVLHDSLGPGVRFAVQLYYYKRI